MPQHGRAIRATRTAHRACMPSSEQTRATRITWIGASDPAHQALSDAASHPTARAEQPCRRPSAVDRAGLSMRAHLSCREGRRLRHALPIAISVTHWIARFKVSPMLQRSHDSGAGKMSIVVVTGAYARSGFDRCHLSFGAVPSRRRSQSRKLNRGGGNPLPRSSPSLLARDASAGTCAVATRIAHLGPAWTVGAAARYPHRLDRLIRFCSSRPLRCAMESIGSCSPLVVGSPPWLARTHASARMPRRA